MRCTPIDRVQRSRRRFPLLLLVQLLRTGRRLAMLEAARAGRSRSPSPMLLLVAVAAIVMHAIVAHDDVVNVGAALEVAVAAIDGMVMVGGTANR